MLLCTSLYRDQGTQLLTGIKGAPAEQKRDRGKHLIWCLGHPHAMLQTQTVRVHVAPTRCESVMRAKRAADETNHTAELETPTVQRKAPQWLSEAVSLLRYWARREDAERA